MQNPQMNTVRGYVPQQNTGSMAPLPYQTAQQPVLSPVDRLKALWAQLDPAAVVLLASLVLGVAYALFSTISFWWLSAILVHLILVWITVLLNGAALFTGKPDFMLFAAIGYAVALLLFLNYCYLLIPQAILCFWAWFKTQP